MRLSNIFLVDHFSHLYRSLTHILASRTPAQLLVLPYSDAVFDEMCRLRPRLLEHHLIEGMTVSKLERSPVHTIRNHRTMRRVARGIGRDDALTICNWRGNSLELRQGLPFSRAGSVRLVEDAAMQVGIPKQGLHKRVVLSLLFAVRSSYSSSAKISAVYVTDRRGVSADLVTKAHEVETFASIGSLASSDRKWLREVFGCPPPPADGDESTIVLTQPLADDIAGVSLEEQVEIYASIVDRCEGIVTLKKHPRDRVVYPFEGHVRQIPQALPQEFLTDEGYRFGIAVGLFSNAVYAANAGERINLFPRGLSEWDTDAAMRSVLAWRPDRGQR